MAESSNYYISPTVRSNNSDLGLDNNIGRITINKHLISLGKCSRFYLYILGAGSFKLLSLLILGEVGFFVDGIGLFGFCPVLHEYNFIQSIFSYIGYIIFGIIFLHFQGSNSLDVEKDENKLTNIILNKHEHSKIILANKIEKDYTNWKIVFLMLSNCCTSRNKKSIIYRRIWSF